MNPVPKKSIPRFSESLTRRRRSAWLDVWAARGITIVAAGVGLATVLVFLFICVEAWPALVGQVSEGPTNTAIASGDLDRVPDESLQRFLGLSPSEFASKTREQLRLLAEVRAETLAEERGEEQGQGGASVHPTHWRHLILPYAWKGYETPVYLWQPSGAGPRFNLIPLWWGTFKVTVIALVVGVPLAMAAALYVSQVATARWRLWLKPIIELIAGIPTVVMGFLALGILAPVFQRVVGVPFLLNGMLAGVAVGVAIVPVIFSLAEDALSAVPRDWVRGALALGATPWEAVRRVVLPAAAPGISAAVLLGAAQALGETMIVMMVSGNAPTLGWSVWDPVRTVPVTLAIELGEAARGGPHYRVLFLMGFLLLVLSVVLQGLARGIRTRQARFRGEAVE
jgi:phosphate transport system permease protein